MIPEDLALSTLEDPGGLPSTPCPHTIKTADTSGSRGGAHSARAPQRPRIYDCFRLNAKFPQFIYNSLRSRLLKTIINTNMVKI